MDISCPRCNVQATPVGHEDARAYFECPACSRIWATLLTSMSEPKGPRPSAVRILVADDSDQLSGLVAAWLEDEQYDVVTASSGRQTLDAAAVYRPDIVLLDLVMPAPGGFEVCAAISGGAHPPQIILMTGVSGPEHLRRALDLGVVALLRKPFTREQVLEAVGPAADRCRRDRQPVRIATSG